MSSRLIPATLITLTAAAGATAAPDDATIKVQRSILDVRLGDTRAEVEDLLGEPRSAKSKDVGGDIGTIVTLEYRKLVVRLQGDGTQPKTIQVTTRDRQDRTVQDAGVGSTRAFVDENVPGTKCDDDACVVGVRKAGRKQTWFLLNSSNRVRAVSLVKPFPGS